MDFNNDLLLHLYLVRIVTSPEPDLGRGLYLALSDLCQGMYGEYTKRILMKFRTSFSDLGSSDLARNTFPPTVTVTVYLSIHYPEPDNCRLINTIITIQLQ